MNSSSEHDDASAVLAMRRMYESGQTLTSVGASFGITRQSVTVKLKAAGVVLRGHARPAAEPFSYQFLHARVKAARGAPQTCEECGTSDPSKRYEWASISRNYADVYDYKRLCKRCHIRFDNIPQKAAATRRLRSWSPARGESHGSARLTNEDVQAIRTRAASGERMVALAKAFGVTVSAISLIVRRTTWKHVP